MWPQGYILETNLLLSTAAQNMTALPPSVILYYDERDKFDHLNSHRWYRIFLLHFHRSFINQFVLMNER